jgi:lipopolysaccharide/colanic/teichoic acid biosynthesis glycosyltransferase
MRSDSEIVLDRSAVGSFNEEPYKQDTSAMQPDSAILSPWVQSFAKRLFDIALVLAGLPIWLPLLLTVAILIRATSAGPILFLQERVGQCGVPFMIFKFRTMVASGRERGTITTEDDPAITAVGRFLRRWKLDEVPQFVNVLRGDMSLVGPRPKVPQQKAGAPRCRPGITGAATLAFADEEGLLVGIPKEELEIFFRDVLLPWKQYLDSRYLVQATFVSDLHLILCTVFRRWEPSEIPRPQFQLEAEPDEAVGRR